MGCGPKWAHDEDESIRERAWKKKCEETLAILGPVVIINEVKRLLISLEETPQTRSTFNSIDYLQKMLDI